MEASQSPFPPSVQRVLAGKMGPPLGPVLAPRLSAGPSGLSENRVIAGSRESGRVAIATQLGRIALIESAKQICELRGHDVCDDTGQTSFSSYQAMGFAAGFPQRPVVFSLKFCKCGEEECLISAGRDGQLRLWDLKSSTSTLITGQLRSASYLDEPLYTFCHDAKGGIQLPFLSGRDRDVHVWDPDGGLILPCGQGFSPESLGRFDIGEKTYVWIGGGCDAHRELRFFDSTWEECWPRMELRQKVDVGSVVLRSVTGIKVGEQVNLFVVTHQYQGSVLIRSRLATSANGRTTMWDNHEEWGTIAPPFQVETLSTSDGTSIAFIRSPRSLGVWQSWNDSAHPIDIEMEEAAALVSSISLVESDKAVCLAGAIRDAKSSRADMGGLFFMDLASGKAATLQHASISPTFVLWTTDTQGHLQLIWGREVGRPPQLNDDYAFYVCPGEERLTARPLPVPEVSMPSQPLPQPTKPQQTPPPKAKTHSWLRTLMLGGALLAVSFAGYRIFRRPSASA